MYTYSYVYTCTCMKYVNLKSEKCLFKNYKEKKINKAYTVYTKYMN